MKWSIVCFLIVLFWNIIRAQDVKVTHPCDIILILNGNSATDDIDCNNTVETVRMFPNYFAMSDNGVQIGVVIPGNILTIAPTTNAAWMRDYEATRNPRSDWTGIDEGLDVAKTVFHDHPRLNASNIVILIMAKVQEPPSDYAQEWFRKAKDSADKLRNEHNVTIFVGFSEMGEGWTRSSNFSRMIAGDDSRVLKFDDSEQLKNHFVRKVSTLIICKYEPILCPTNDSTSTVSTEPSQVPLPLETEGVEDDIENGENRVENSKKTEDDEEFPIWLMVVCIIVACAMVFLVIAAVLHDRKIQKWEASAKQFGQEMDSEWSDRGSLTERTTRSESPSQRKKKRRKNKSPDRSASLSENSTTSVSYDSIALKRQRRPQRSFWIFGRSKDSQQSKQPPSKAIASVNVSATTSNPSRYVQ